MRSISIPGQFFLPQNKGVKAILFIKSLKCSTKLICYLHAIPTFLILLSLILLHLPPYKQPPFVLSIPCQWDYTLSPEHRKKENCGFFCSDPWSRSDPHYCGAPASCCCAPKCNTALDSQTNFVGVNWSDKYSRLVLPRTKAFKHAGFRDIKMFSPDGLRDIYDVYGNDVRVYVGIPNRDLTNIGSNLDYARHIVKQQLMPFKSIIKLLIVGNEPFLCIRSSDWAVNGECGSLNIPSKLLIAMKNMKKALDLEGLPLPVSVSFNGGILEMSKNPWTPCISDYKVHLKPLLRPIWEFLRSQPAPFIVNIYSWFASMAGHIPPPLAVGHPYSVLPSDGRYNYYFNYDMQHDMQRLAMCFNEITDLELWIGETGWPSGNHPKATPTNAKYYMQNVAMRAQGMQPELFNKTLDTIRFPGLRFPVFLFEAFDEDKKFEIEHGNRFENTFGLFYEDGTPKWVDEFGNLDVNIPNKVAG